jgi:hypothetical protein
MSGSWRDSKNERGYQEGSQKHSKKEHGSGKKKEHKGGFKKNKRRFRVGPCIIKSNHTLCQVVNCYMRSFCRIVMAFCAGSLLFWTPFGQIG